MLDAPIFSLSYCYLFIADIADYIPMAYLILSLSSILFILRLIPLHQHHYSSASAHSARILTQHLSLEGHWLQIPSIASLDDTYHSLTDH